VLGSLRGVPEYRGPFRVGTRRCVLEEVYVYNKAFAVQRGAEFFGVDGILRFTPGKEPQDRCYRTVFGPAVSHNGVIFCNCNSCVAYALRRLTAVRLPEQPGMDASLFAQQDLFFLENRSVFASLCLNYVRHFSDYRGREEEGREHHADPHDKRDLRIQAWRELCESGDVVNTGHTWLSQGKVNMKFKNAEIAKPGKRPRSIGDLKVPASLAGFRVMGMLKEAQAAEEFEYLGGHMRFVKSPNPHVLEDVFRKLIDPPGRYYFCYFSDDSCFSLRVGSKVLLFNLDISTCDASHGPSVFLQLELNTPVCALADVRVLVDQACAPFVIRSRVCGSRERVVLQPLKPKLYSGSTITTAINNIANQAICVALAQMIYLGPQSIVDAAARAGYVLTGVEPLLDYSQLQFLKNSPVYDLNGDLRPLLNIGVLLRASGVCHGDLPGRGDLALRARRFQQGLLQGAYPRVSFPLLVNMRSACGGVEPFEESTRIFRYKVDQAEDYPSFKCSADAVYRRYSLTTAQISQVDEDFGRSTFGECTANDALATILSLDYGLGVNYTTCAPVAALNWDEPWY
jgi:hypothetical protein